MYFFLRVRSPLLLHGVGNRRCTALSGIDCCPMFLFFPFLYFLNDVECDVSMGQSLGISFRPTVIFCRVEWN